MTIDDRLGRLMAYQNDAHVCTTCHASELVHIHETHGHAKPMLQRSPTGALGILVVGEAPNNDDTYNPKKGHLTYGKDTDPTGSFMWKLLTEEVGLRENEIDDVLFTNAVLCLPKERNGKYPVTSHQLDACRPWLKRLMKDADVKVVVAMGDKALQALGRVEKHGLTLKDAGKLYPWFGRKLLPLFHAGMVGRVSRPEALQRQDIRLLRECFGK